VARSRVGSKLTVTPQLTRLAFLIAVTILAAAPPAVARPTDRPLRCGDMITRDTRLTVNLTDCPADGLVIAADGVTLDLSGHRIDGSGDGVGIAVRGHRGVTVENGTVRGFAEGVFALEARDIAIRRITSTDEGHGGLLVDRGHGVTVADNVVRRCGAGIIVTRSDQVRVRANRITDSAAGGIPVFESQYVVITGNIVTTSRADMGIGLTRGSSHSAIIGNRISRSGAGIVLADGAAHNLVSRNLVRRSDSGVVVDVGTHDNDVVDNVIEDSAFEGIAVVGSDRDLIRRNTVARSGRVDPAGGIVVIPWPDDPARASDRTVIAGNLAFDNRGDGITVGAGQTGNVLRRNRARRNSGLGMNAAPGTIDGGGNSAQNNGDPRQCVGVVCTT
jgi:parallel beta-helix repeat protein